MFTNNVPVSTSTRHLSVKAGSCCTAASKSALLVQLHPVYFYISYDLKKKAKVCVFITTNNIYQTQTECVQLSRVKQITSIILNTEYILKCVECHT